jgi:Flp pilus assembly pilin Flp
MLAWWLQLRSYFWHDEGESLLGYVVVTFVLAGMVILVCDALGVDPMTALSRVESLGVRILGASLWASGGLQRTCSEEVGWGKSCGCKGGATSKSNAQNSVGTHLCRDEGQDLVEYAMLFGFIAIMAVVAVTVAGLNLLVLWDMLAAWIEGVV